MGKLLAVPARDNFSSSGRVTGCGRDGPQAPKEPFLGPGHAVEVARSFLIGKHEVASCQARATTKSAQSDITSYTKCTDLIVF
jgi:hypothetical protein